MNVAMERKEVVRFGASETKAVEPVLRATKLSKQYGSVTGIPWSGGLKDGDGTV